MHLCASKSRGFTLVEMLIALAIFSLVSMTAGSLLYQAVEAQSRATVLGDRLIDVERGLGRIARDLAQFVSRDVRDELGGTVSAMQISLNMIEFTRSGWSNPAQHARSELQRVRYSVKEGALQRDYWDVLDRAPESMPRSQKIIDKVEWVNFEPIAPDHLVDGELDLHGLDEEQIPLGVRVLVSVQGYGELIRVLELPMPLPEESGADPDTSQDSDLPEGSADQQPEHDSENAQDE